MARTRNTPDHPETSEAGVQAKAKAEDADAAVADQVQTAVDVETEQGYRGAKVDPTPNEHYTAAGVTAGKPTPETDPKSAAKAAEQLPSGSRFQ